MQGHASLSFWRVRTASPLSIHDTNDDTPPLERPGSDPNLDRWGMPHVISPRLIFGIIALSLLALSAIMAGTCVCLIICHARRHRRHRRRAPQSPPVEQPLDTACVSGHSDVEMLALK